MDSFEKLKILTNAAKYDVACTSSGVARGGRSGSIGNAVSCGICHSFAADGRCISLLKVLMTNYCSYDCRYCVNRHSNDVPRTAFSPRELAELTIQFYRRNYIEGLFLSSAVLKSPDYTMERMIQTLELLRHTYHFNGYIHAKAIPGADPLLLQRLGYLADRLSVNIELPSQQSLRLLAPDKSKESILTPMQFIDRQNRFSLAERSRFHSAPSFAPGGQSTQMIIGATPDSDRQILCLSQSLYDKYHLKRVFFSAYTPVVSSPELPALHTEPPLLREHRLYQADWLLRFYGYRAEELLDESQPYFHPLLDPKADWALHHPECFPVEVTTASYQTLLRVPGIGPASAKRIVASRRASRPDFVHLQRMGVVLKRARYFITCSGHTLPGIALNGDRIPEDLISPQGLRWLEQHSLRRPALEGEQLSLFASAETPPEERLRSCLRQQNAFTPMTLPLTAS